MDFALTSEYEMIRTSVRDFAENVLKPNVADRDEREYFDRSVFSQMAELA
jgi:alkylation response protein AidB-like acyl-CoA dehydrogenase